MSAAPDAEPRVKAESPAARVLAELVERPSRSLEVVVPEGVPLVLALPDLGVRASAFFMDILFCVAASVLFALPLMFVSPRLANEVVFVCLFVARNLYFIGFEAYWRGATPGKRALGLRVISRSIDRLSPQAIVARNLMREVEFFTPIQMILIAGSWVRSPWEVLPVAVWLGFFALVPALDRDRRRAGDYVAGTLVVALPQVQLLADASPEAFKFTFLEAELKAYGEDELKVLDHVLRQQDGSESEQLRRSICDRICNKIGRTEPVHDVDRFLRDFYLAQRMHLERRRLFGKERRSKLDQ